MIINSGGNQASIFLSDFDVSGFGKLTAIELESSTPETNR